MRSTSFFAALVVAAALAALLVARQQGGEPAATVAGGTVTLVGDSLNVGIEPYVPEALPHWRVVAADRVGRLTAEAIAELEAGRPALSTHVVVSLGTNDPRDDVARFRVEVGQLLELIGPGRCVVWATIWRRGAPDEAFNAVLRDAAESNRRLRLVEWAEMVEAKPERLAGDGVHGTATGYRDRALAVADEIRACAAEPTLVAG